MATRDIANNIGNTTMEFGRTTGQRASSITQNLLDRMLRSTGSGASSAGENMDSTFNSWAGSLPQNRAERSRTRRRLAMGLFSIAAIGTSIKYGGQIINRFRGETQPDEQSTGTTETATLEGTSGTTASAVTPAAEQVAPYPAPIEADQRTPQRTTAAGSGEASAT